MCFKFQNTEQLCLPSYITPLTICVVGGAAVSVGAAFESRVRGAPAALPVEPGAGQHAHAGLIRDTSKQVN